MIKAAISFFCFIFIVTLFAPEAIWSQKTEPALHDFKVQALYRAAKLTWKARDGLTDRWTAQILRAETFEEGPYQEVDVVNVIPGKNAYEYIDKSMGAESKYYYKLVLKETGESFGPIPTRPFFSPPATQWQPRERRGALLAFREARR